MKLTRIAFLTIVCCALMVSSCSRSHNLVLGRIESQVGKHTVIVTDCYRTEVAPPQQLENTKDGKLVYRFAPCKDASILIEGSRLIVNGNPYGELADSDEVLIEHGKVLINNIEVSAKTGD